MRRKLTAQFVGSVQVAQPGREEYWDVLAPGLGIRVSSSGRKAWMILRQGTRLKIGAYPAMSLADARTKARELMAGTEVLAGEKLFKTLVEEFLRHGRTRKGRELRQNSIDQYRRNLSRYARPLNSRKFAEIQRRDIAALLRDVANESGAPTASLIRAMLSRLWSFAIEVGEAEFNLVAGTPAYEVPKRSRVLSDSELRAIWAATEEREPHNVIIRLLLMLGARRGEVGGMRWSELVDGEWRIPGSRTKNHVPLTLQLPRQAITELSRWPRVVGQDTLFGRAGFTSWPRAKRRLDARLGFARDWDLHDCRRTVETRMSGLGVPKVVSDKILNHAMPIVTQSYDFYDYAAEKAAAIQQWSDKLQAITSQAEPAIVRLRQS